MFLKLWGRIQRCFTRNSGFILLFFILNYFTMAWSLTHQHQFELLIESAAMLLLGTMIFSAVLEKLTPQKILPYVKKVILFLCFIPFVVELFVMYNYRALIGAGIINSLLETNFKESLEFLKMYIGVKELCAIAGAVAVIIIGWRLHLWKRIQISYHRQSRLLGLSLILCIAAAIPAMAVYSDFILYQLLPMQRTYTAMGTAIDNMKAYHRLSEKMTSTVSLTRNESKIKNVIFILGESTNRNHMQLYGYYLPNSPHLMKLQEKGEIAVFKDIVSPHSTTIAVLSELFTFCDHESGKPWYEYNTLIDVMHAAGYKTFWLSNQESSGAWGNVAQIYANHSDYHKFTRIRDSLEDTGILDGELFPLIDESKALRSDDKNFFVVHLMGGHGLYYNRYPYEFNKFTGKDIKLNVSERFKEVVAQYDNALYYNDYVVDEIINRFRDDEAIVIYVPDHAEAVYDEGSVAGHIEENPNRHMIEIPMIVWASAKFKEKYPDKWEQIQDAVDRPYMTDDMIHTILDLTDIATEDYRSDKSLINEEFDASRPRIFNDLNYDTQIREKKL